MFHPSRFEVDEAWIAFKPNDEPLRTGQDGDVRFLALMDAASCFILGFASVSTLRVEPAQSDSERLLKEGQARKKRWPETPFVTAEQPVQMLVAEPERLGIGVVRVAGEQFSPFIGETQEGFRERFGSRGASEA